ncbi:MAG: hypothetical protein ACO1O1_13870 [Adhaeribacter sp.]
MQHLSQQKFIYQLEDYYSLHNDPGLATRRKSENKRAQALLPKARMISRLLHYIPFVRAISISGSLSKNVASPEADFDYFIITQTNRLWIARTLLALLIRCSYLVGKQDWFCLNYYIDESRLQIPEQNIYTATEIVTLIISRPNPTTYLFLDANAWVSEYYPNYQVHQTGLKAPTLNVFRSGLELLFNLAIPDKVDTWLMNKTVGRLKKKKATGNLVTDRGKVLELPLCDRHYCKHNPDFLQAEVLRSYQQKLDLLLSKYQESNRVMKDASPAP